MREDLGEKFHRACLEGRAAYRHGLQVQECPYDRLTFGMKSFWMLGWRLEELKASSGHEVAAP